MVMQRTERRDRVLIVLFALTIFISAYLLFQVQPLISKFILPWFGGSPTVWTTAMLFFQCVLCGGYFYAHLITRHASPHVQAWTHVTLLTAAALLAVFVVPGEYLRPEGNENPIGRILLLLGWSVGLPYFCLATTGPLIQYWFTRFSTDGSAFRLYALSNAGSFLALLSFPYLFEPFFEIPRLGQFWTAGFWVFAVLCATVALRIRDQSPVQRKMAAAPAAHLDAEITAVPSVVRRISWILLPALASLAFITTTDHVSHDIAPEPKLWIATLSLYLLTFIICFDHSRWYRRGLTAVLCLIAIILLTGRNEIPGWFGIDADYSLTDIRWSHLATMFLICFMSHGELYRQRPGNPRYLTEFYLLMSLGGACGGLFVALGATNFFADYYEWSLCLIAAIGLACFIISSERYSSRTEEAGASVERKHGRLLAATALGTAFFGGLVFFWDDPLSLRTEGNDEYATIRLHQSRNFYGAVSVEERRYHKDPARNHRIFYSGQVTHGVQYLDPAKRRLPVTYYSPESGAGETLRYAMDRNPSLRVAVIGLGAGTLATYARDTDHYDFYEINPEVVRIANQWFDNVPECRARTKETIIGDARLKMAQLPVDVKYDVITLDAFSGGSVPIHLLTREAFEIYRQHLKPNGYIVVHITNGYLNLYPVIKRQAEHAKMGFRNKFQASDPERHVRHNHYFVMTNDHQYLERFPSVNRKHHDAAGQFVREEDPDLPDVPLWTDHFSSLNAIEIGD